MKKKYRRLLIVFGLFCLIIGGIFIFRDKPLVCTREVKLANGVKITDKITIPYKSNEVVLIKVNKAIDLDEHADVSYLSLLKNELDKKYEDIKDKDIYVTDNILYFDALITKGKYDINSFIIELKKDAIYVVENNKSYNINIDDDIEKVKKTFNSLYFSCE